MIQIERRASKEAFFMSPICCKTAPSNFNELHGFPRDSGESTQKKPRYECFTDRRSMLRGALTAGAAATVAGIPAMAARAEADPVFALLEAHRAAWARFEELDGSDHEAFTAAAVTVDAALEELTSTPPTTPAGMRAVIEYLVELDGHADYLPTLLRSSIRSPLLAG
jgi:hypothetical protein